jgi:hypothetical protein
LVETLPVNGPLPINGELTVKEPVMFPPFCWIERDIVAVLPSEVLWILPLYTPAMFGVDGETGFGRVGGRAGGGTDGAVGPRVGLGVAGTRVAVGCRVGLAVGVARTGVGEFAAG